MEVPEKAEYPRVLTALDLAWEMEDEPVFCGPFLLESLAEQDHGRWPFEEPPEPTWPKQGQLEEAPRHEAPRHESPRRRRRSPECQIAPPGHLDSDGQVGQKFIAIFPIALEDDDSFCLVKRIIGKAGCNMRRIAEECNAKVRLRGIGSGFLEGSEGIEANMPLQLCVSCVDYESYAGATSRVTHHLKDLYKHYRRYCRAEGLEVPDDLTVQIQEVRRDDLGIDVLHQKASRSSSQRARDRGERRALRREAHDRGEQRVPGYEAQAQDPRACHPGHRGSAADSPAWAHMPTTAIGRRAAVRAGGAKAGACVSAMARAERQALRAEREAARAEREAAQAGQRAARAERQAARAGRRRGERLLAESEAADRGKSGSGRRAKWRPRESEPSLAGPVYGPPPPPPLAEPSDPVNLAELGELAVHVPATLLWLNGQGPRQL